MERSIIVKTTFEGTHCYVDAPEEVNFLRNLHRHLFYVEAEIEVFHDDRELEFLMVKNRINNFLQNDVMFAFKASCEQMAEAIIKYIVHEYGERQVVVTVYEDNENGGRVYHEV